MSYLQALKKATKTKEVPYQKQQPSEFIETSIGTPDTSGDAAAKKWYESLTPEQQQRLKSKVESHFSKKNPAMVANQNRNEDIDMNRSKQQALLKEQYKKDKEWQDKRDQTALQNQQKEVEAARNAEIKARNDEIKRKQKIKIDAGQVAVDVRRSNQEIKVLERDMNLLSKKLVDAGDTKNRTVSRWKQERSDMAEEIAILKMEMDNQLESAVDAATDKYGDDDGVKYLISNGISQERLLRIMSRK